MTHKGTMTEADSPEGHREMVDEFERWCEDRNVPGLLGDAEDLLRIHHGGGFVAHVDVDDQMVGRRLSEAEWGWLDKFVKRWDELERDSIAERLNAPCLIVSGFSTGLIFHLVPAGTPISRLRTAMAKLPGSVTMPVRPMSDLA